MDEEENDQAFELEDYTNCGELEKFISQIEDVLQEWNLNSLNRYDFIFNGKKFLVLTSLDIRAKRFSPHVQTG